MITKRAYHVLKTMTIDGKVYQPGEIVMCAYDLPGLKRAGTSWDTLKFDIKFYNSNGDLFSAEVKNEKPITTLLSLISRDCVLEQYFDQLPRLGLPKQTDWLILVDGDSKQIYDHAKVLMAKYEGNFLSAKIGFTNQQTLAYCTDFEDRGYRVSGLLKILLDEVKTDRFFMVEDDTLAPDGAYEKLNRTFSYWDTIAYVSGIECGRGFIKNVGCCLFKEEDNEIIAKIMPPMQSGLMDVDGGGWYCWVGSTVAIKKFINEVGFKCDGQRILGPDVLMVHALKKMGYKCLVDFDVQCKHYDEVGRVWLPANEGKQFIINYSLGTNGWQYKIL